MKGGFNIKNLIALYLIACSLLLAQGASEDNKSESIDDLLAVNLSNETTLNRTVFNYTAFNSSNPNLSEFSLSEFGSDFNPSELACVLVWHQITPPVNV
jgi:hypothetical protein